MTEQKMPEFDPDIDLAGCWNTLVDHARERHVAGKEPHPAWLAREAPRHDGG